MSYTLVKGSFRLFYKTTRHVGSRPDGDSVWFEPDNLTFFSDLGNPPRDTDYNKGGFAQLRFEGIDALELHYKGINHQKKEGCVSARDKMLELLGFEDLEYAPTADIPSYVRDLTPQSIRGHILTRNIDPFGRPVAFVFSGEAQEPDGADIWLDTRRLSDSINANLMAEGEAYSAYYTGLPTDLRNHLTSLATAARQNNDGVWSMDSSSVDNQVTSIDDLENLAIWPKLYRRLFKFFKAGNDTVEDFDGWLRADPHGRDDQIWIIPQAHLGNIHDIVEVSGDNIKMLYRPKELIIVPR
jgi:endonuclease YncB( thermonuclease family)